MAGAEFRISIGPWTNDGYGVHATSPKGSESGLLVPSFPLDRLDETFAFLGARAGLSLTASERLALIEGASAESEVKRLGHELYQALFCGPIGELWHRSLGGLSSEVSTLTLCLELDPKLDGVSNLLRIPWEILFDGRDFLSRRRRTPILRSIGGPADAPVPALPSPLRVLCVVAEPDDQDCLDLESELRGIEQAARHRRGIEIITRRPESLAELAQLIREGEIHVLHFAGHGAFDPETGVGAIFLRSGDGASHAVFGEDLAEVLKDLPSLRLAVLNACDTAKSSSTEVGRPFAGVAMALMQAIPAVVAMQFPLADNQAVTFASCLYRRLVRGEPIELAVTEARLAMLAEGPYGFDWAIPALYTSLPGEHLFMPPAGVTWTASRSALRHYLAQVVDEHRALEISVPSTVDEVLSGPAEELFVEPWCRPAPTSHAARENPGVTRQGPFAEFGGAAQVRVESALKTHPCLALLGEMGSGKTALVQRLAARMAAARLDHATEDETAKTPPVPVLVSATTLARARRELGISTLHALFAPEAHRRSGFTADDAVALAETLPALFDDGDLTLLIDGLDEIMDARERRDVYLEIEALATERQTQTSGNRWIITSRPGAWFAHSTNAIAAFQLAPLGPIERAQLVARWSRRLAGGSGQLDSLLTEAGQSECGELSNPWFLSLRCWLGARGRKDGGLRRVDVSAAAVDALCETWSRRAEGNGGLPLPLHELVELLSEAAAKAQEGSDELTDEWIWKAVAHRAPQAEVKRIGRTLVEQSGFLAPPFDGSLRFRDRALQEYLAAGPLVREVEEAPGRFFDRGLDARTRPLVVLALGRASRELDATRLERSLKALLAQDVSPIPRAALWLAAAIPEMPSVPAGLVAEVAKRLLATLAGPAQRALHERSEAALARLLSGNHAAEAKRILAEALGSRSQGAPPAALAAARVLLRTGPPGNDLAALLAEALPFDEASDDRPVDGALRALALRSPHLLEERHGSLRQALRHDPRLRERLLDDSGWLRITLALYGGFVPGGSFEPERIHRDGPLAKRIVTALQRGEPATSLSPELQSLWQSSEPRLASEAFIALIALGKPVEGFLRPGDPTTDGARDRLRHLSRTLDPFAAASFGSCLDGLRELSDECPPETWSDLLAALLRIALHSGGSPAQIRPLLSSVPAGSRPAFLAELFHAHLAAPYSVYNFAVLLDEAGEPLSSPAWDLAGAMARAAESLQAGASRRRGWRLPDTAQVAATPQDLLATALDILEGLPPALDFVHGWMLARLTPLLAEKGLWPEAFILGLSLSDKLGARDDTCRFLLRGAPPGWADLDPSHPDLGSELFRRVQAIPDSRLRRRSLARFYRRFPELGWESADATFADLAAVKPAGKKDAGADLSILLRYERPLARPDGSGIPLLLRALLDDFQRPNLADSPQAGLDTAVELEEVGRQGPDALESLLAALGESEDLPRFQAFLDLAGDRSETRWAASSQRLGSPLLESLARKWILSHRLQPGVAQALDWALERVQQDDGQAISAWAEHLARGGPGAEEGEILLSRLHDLHPRIWPVFCGLLQDSQVPVQRALLRSLCFLAARRRLPPDRWREVSVAVAGWDSDAVGHEPFLLDLPLALVEAAEHGRQESGKGGDIAQAVVAAELALASRVQRLARVLQDSDRLPVHLAAIGAIRVAPARYDRTLAAAAGRAERSPEIFAVLLAWLSQRLGETLNDSAPFLPLLSDLLGVVAAAAERLPETFRHSAAGSPQLDRRLREAVELHNTFTGRRAALSLLALRGLFTRETAAALRAALRDVPQLQDAALQSLSRFSEIEPGALDELLDDPSTLTVYAATRLATSLSASGGLSPHDRDRLSKWSEAAVQETGSVREVWTLRPEKGQIKPVSLGRLGDAVSHLLLEIHGVGSSSLSTGENR